MGEGSPNKNTFHGRGVDISGTTYMYCREYKTDKCLSHLRLAALFDMLSLKEKYLISNCSNQ